MDSPENIFNHLVFSDENDVVYEDDEYKTEHKEYDLNEIVKDLAFYGYHFENVKVRVDVNNFDSEDVAFIIDDMIGNNVESEE